MKKPLLLTRDVFRESVFSRDDHRCVFCGKRADETPEGKLDAHHIIERRLFQAADEFGGYFVSNGATVCEEHHRLCEQTVISVEDVRIAAGITTAIVPSHLYDGEIYDKWGNTVLPNGTRVKGELFKDESVQKILEEGGVLHLFQKYWKHPRLHHLPWSPGMQNDDRRFNDIRDFHGKEVVVTTKIDGEQCLQEDAMVVTNLGTITIKEACENSAVSSVLSYDEATDEVCFRDIQAKKISENTTSVEWFEIEMEDGRTLTLTGNHRVYLPVLGCYRRVDELTEDDLLLIS